MDNHEVREKLIELSECKKIKHKKKFLQQCKEETLEKISVEYKAEQLHEVNAQLTETLISKFSALLGEMELVKDGCKLEGDLKTNDLLKKDMEKIVGYIAPYVPLIGLISGGVTVAGHVVDKAVFDIPGKKLPNPEELKRTTAQEQYQTDQEKVQEETES